MVETTLDLIEAKKCGLCYEWLDVAEMQWDAEPYCYTSARMAKSARPAARERRGSVHAAPAAMRTCLASCLYMHVFCFCFVDLCYVCSIEFIGLGNRH